ncbi:hypothetical protein E4U25_002826 [Claviceps purpurea]|nr:hypothetical protein E4U25_002826 [Claviceps purpurea]
MPWVDIDFILEAQQIWAGKYARRRCYRHYETGGLSIRKLYKTKVHARDRYMQHVRQHQEKTWKFDARACFEADYERALRLLGSADLHPDVRTPVDLLTGPWDEEKKRRLFWFVRAGVFQPSNGFINGKVRLASLDAAMISPENGPSRHKVPDDDFAVQDRLTAQSCAQSAREAVQSHSTRR